MLKSRFSTGTPGKRTSVPVQVQVAKHVSMPVSIASTAATEAIVDSEALGSVVAFEGHPETISTQLRLLPTSPQILILPSVQCYLATDNDDQQQLQVHDYIRKAHDAVKARNETARAFLKAAQPGTKRLVFMNGGTPSAQALCIRHIMKHETQGDDVEAENMFNFLVREGMGGLEAQSQMWFRKDFVQTEMSPKAKSHSPRHKKQLQEAAEVSREELDEDPITRAMRAAEALDRSTANLQPSNELDLTLGASRPRSYSLPMYGYSDNFGDAAPFFVFGARKRATSDASIEEAVEDMPLLPMTPRFAVTHYEEGNLDEPILTGYTDPEQSPACAGDTYGPTFLHSPLVDALPTSRSDVFDIRSPSDVTFGEASLLDMRSTPTSSRGPVTRVRSLDRIYTPTSKMRDLCIPPDVAEDENDVPKRPQSCLMIRKDSDTSSIPTPIDGPRTILVRSKQSNVVSLKSVPPGKKRKDRSSYVDRGTDAEAIEEKKEPFAPVLPMTEDLVVYLKDDAPDALLDNAIKSFRDGSYPVLPNSPEGSDTETVTDQLPTTPKSQSQQGGERGAKAADRDEPKVASPSTEVDEYDPFAYVQNSWPPVKVARSHSQTNNFKPPTPEKTPEPSVAENKDDKFHEFKFSSTATAVAIQNSLRSVLEVYFPPEAQGYRQFNFAMLPELEGLWKPIFREAEPGSPRTDNRRMDQILAIGSQKSVKKEYSSVIVGLLDKLGCKKSGMSRSGRLDFRYLLANAMQAFTAQPLSNQTADNPFNNPYLLATLIIPHLETYLALHSEVRYLLLEYPPEHLSTILALQKLVGVGLMKVAQIVDSKNTDIGPFTHLRGASINSQREKQSPLGKPMGSGTAADVIVSKANFLLTSSASDAEIATFIATVRKILMEVSKFYNPEEPPQPPAPPKKPASVSGSVKNKPKPLSGNISAFPKTSGPLSPTATSPTNTIAPYRSLSPQPSTRAASIAETVRTFRTARTGKSTKKSKRRRPPTAGEDGQSVFTYDPSADSDYDDEERRLMPIFLARHHRRPKPNSRKALKFLGLA